MSPGSSDTLRALRSARSFKTQFRILIRLISVCSATCHYRAPLDPDVYFSEKAYAGNCLSLQIYEITDIIVSTEVVPGQGVYIGGFFLLLYGE